ncbi:amino acid transporter [Opitutaceae bacterium TAV1]|nr:amino acid transporter [Opitutaceae bacterium TAV1]
MESTSTIAANGIAAPLPVQANRLRPGVLGAGAITFLVISAASPLVGIAGGFPVAMLLGNGAGLPLALCLAVSILLAFAAGYTAMARHLSNAGGFYAITSQGIGGTAGSASAMIALVSYNCMQIGIYGMFGVAASGLVQDIAGISLPWWLYVFGAIGAIAILGYRQVDLSMKVLLALVVGEFIGVLLLDISILKSGGAAGFDFTSFTPAAFFSGSPAIGLLFCFASFVGFEATTIYSEEARNPERTIPLATYLSVLIVGVFYAFSVWCMVVGAGAEGLVETIAELGNPVAFTFGLSDRFAGSWLTLLLRILFVSGVFAGLLAFHNTTARYFYTIGRDGLLPGRLGTTHSKHQSPHAGSVCQTTIAASVILVFALAGADPILTLFSWLTNVGTLGILVLMTIASVAVILFFRNHRELAGNAWRTLVLPAAAGVAFALIAALAVYRFDLLTGASKALSMLLPALVLAAVVAGIVLATLLRSRDPRRFDQLGRHKV